MGYNYSKCQCCGDEGVPLDTQGTCLSCNVKPLGSCTRCDEHGYVVHSHGRGLSRWAICTCEKGQAHIVRSVSRRAIAILWERNPNLSYARGTE